MNLVVLFAYHGSNSWMMLSKRMTAKSRDEKPANHANANTVNTIKLFAPDGFINFEEFDIAAGDVTVAAIIQYHQLNLIPRPRMVNSCQPIRSVLTVRRPIRN